MTTLNLPALPPGIEYLGPPDGPEETSTPDGGLDFPVLWARYRVHGLSVSIGWIVGHKMGSFKLPNQLRIDFDSSDFAQGYGQEGAAPFEGITTALLRSIPMAHARALMRPRFEELSVADVARSIFPLPSRVETDDEYLHIATAFVALCEVSLEPIQRLAQYSNSGTETWAARIRRARSKGMLVGKGTKTTIAPEFQDRSESILKRIHEGGGVGGD